MVLARSALGTKLRELQEKIAVAPDRTTVAAIQMEARVADIPYNLSHVEKLIDEAGRKGAKVIALPEFFTTQIIYDERLFACSLPPKNMALDLLLTKAQQYNAQIGGSYLEMRDGDVYNTYVLVEPNGTVYRHDKDLPTMVENAFYIGGQDDGQFETDQHRVGIAMCWEMIRTQTAQRLRGRVDLLMAGSHWWGAPDWSVFESKGEKYYKESLEFMHTTPGKIAGMVGAPLVHAGHAGTLEGRVLMFPGTRITSQANTHLTGESQIIDRQGTIVAQRHRDLGAGIVIADIEIGAVPPKVDVPNRFWIPEKLGLYRLFWWHQNACGKVAYKHAKKRGALKTHDLIPDVSECALPS